MEEYKMGKLNDIEQKLISGSTPSQLVKEGEAKSSVTFVARKLKKAEPVSTPTPLATDELQQLRHQKEVAKLKKEIAEIEDSKDNMPERVAALEKAVLELRSLVTDAVDTAIMVCLEYAGMDRKQAKQYADGWVGRNIKG